MLDELDADLKKQAQRTVSVYRFDEYFGGVLIDNTAITVSNRNGANLAAVHRRIYKSVKPTNSRKLSPRRPCGARSPRSSRRTSTRR